MVRKDIPDVSYLRQILRYEPETGLLFWRMRSPAMFRGNSALSPDQMCQWWNTRYAGKEAFTATHNGRYRYGSIEGRGYRAHRVAWVILHGRWPNQIDHINGDGLDNRAANLRDVTPALNSRNVPLYARNKSGRIGVSWETSKGKWRAQISTDTGAKHLGYFDCIEDAAAARDAAERSNGYHINHGRAASRELK